MTVGAETMLEPLHAAPAKQRTLARRKLHLLDVCLSRLEDAMELGENCVSSDIAATYGALVPGLVAPMALDKALDLVFVEQEKWVGLPETHAKAPTFQVVRAPAGEAAAPCRSAVGELGKAEARSLTERIKAGLRDTCLLMHQAHEGRAWAALGYKTWEAYVRREFGLSRSRSYELLDQANVVLAIRAAAGMSGMPDVSARRAARIKPYLADVLEAVRARCSSEASSAEVLAVVRSVVNDKRLVPAARRHTAMPDRAKASTRLGADNSVSANESLHTSMQLRLRDVIAYLADLPPFPDIAEGFRRDDLPGPDRVARAVAWLNRFATEYPRLVSVSRG